MTLDMFFGKWVLRLKAPFPVAAIADISDGPRK